MERLLRAQERIAAVDVVVAADRVERVRVLEQRRGRDLLVRAVVHEREFDVGLDVVRQVEVPHEARGVALVRRAPCRCTAAS